MLAHRVQVGGSAWAPLILVCALACDDGVTPSSGDAGRKTRPTTVHDAGPSAKPGTGGMTGGSQSFPFFDGGFPNPVPIQGCIQQVGAECDDRADCAPNKVCCGHVNIATLSYDSIACQTSCGAIDEFELCHSIDSCSAGLVCRSSLRIPYAVCASPLQGVASATEHDQQGRVTCGATSCAVGQEKCCLASRVDPDSLLPTAEPPYCAPLAQADACQCDHHDQPIVPDAGAKDAGSQDAGGP
jgi:hypothetical protein